MIRYYKLFDILNRRELNKTDLRVIANLSGPTITKLVQGKYVTTDIINRICKGLAVQPGDIMEYIPDTEENNKK